jgi:hypothetical protein
MRWSSWLLIATVASACSRRRKPEIKPQPVHVELHCGDEVRQLEVVDDISLDDALCDEPWEGWQLDGGRTIELVRRVESRSLHLRRRAGAAVVEVTLDGKVTASYPGVTTVTWRGKPPQRREDLVLLRHGDVSERLTIAEIRQRDDEHGSGGASRDASLCKLLGAAPESATIRVFGDDVPAGLTFTRVECERDGLILRQSGRGGIRLRTGANATLIRTVQRVEI